MPDKLQMERAGSDAPRPMVLAIAGDSAAGKTTLTEGLVKAWDADWITSLCVELPTLRPGRTIGTAVPRAAPRLQLHADHGAASCCNVTATAAFIRRSTCSGRRSGKRSNDRYPPEYAVGRGCGPPAAGESGYGTAALTTDPGPHSMLPALSLLGHGVRSAAPEVAALLALIIHEGYRGGSPV